MNFGADTFVPNEGFTGTENTRNAIAFGLSTGTFDPALRVVALDPPAGSIVELPFRSLKVTFSQPYDPGSIGTNDLILSKGSVTGFRYVDPTTVEYLLDIPGEEGPLLVSMPDRSVNDPGGDPGGGFSALYTLDFGTAAYPVPLTPVEPLGSLIYDPSQSGIIDPAGDTDSFTISVDPGQRITVVVEAGDGLRPTVSLADAEGVLASATAAAPGADAVLQDVATRGQIAGNGPRPRTYTITVGGADGTSGAYLVKIVLNAAVEEESHGGAANGDLSGAQPLDGSLIPLHGAVDELTTELRPERGAVLGTIAGSAPTTVPGPLANAEGNANNGFPFALGFSSFGAMRYQQIYSAGEFAARGA